jgi:tetratricopeptide (TPR) repeat protein
MARGDFSTAANYLETALIAAPDHRGIIKNLGYAYTWLGQFDKAQILLREIPEAKQELETYIWWWEAQGRRDLAKYAVEMRNRLGEEITP